MRMRGWALSTHLLLAAAMGCSPSLRPLPAAPQPGALPSAVTDSASAHAAAVRFLAAFDSLQWEPFTAFLADDVTMFFPFTGMPARVDGRAAVEAAFGPFFASVREAGQESLGIAPRALRVQMAGPDVAVVTFQLGAATPARRSIVFVRRDGAWEVLHWHASPAPQPPPRAEGGNAATAGVRGDPGRFEAGHARAGGCAHGLAALL
jgi:ketosteroid isomerase-like protein